MPAEILDNIVRLKKKDIERKRKKVPLDELKENIARGKKPLNFSSAIKGSKIKLIAEVKKASPSRGVLCPDFKPVEMAAVYAENGAGFLPVSLVMRVLSKTVFHTR